MLNNLPELSARTGLRLWHGRLLLASRAAARRQLAGLHGWQAMDGQRQASNWADWHRISHKT